MAGNLAKTDYNYGVNVDVDDCEYSDEGFTCSTGQTGGDKALKHTDGDCNTNCADLEAGPKEDMFDTLGSVIIEIDPNQNIDDRVYSSIEKRISQIINKVIADSIASALENCVEVE